MSEKPISPLRARMILVRNPTYRGHSFRSIADSIPVIADSW